MNAILLRLELRKNALAAASVAAAFLLTLPVSRLVAAAAGLETFKALEAILYGWLLAGLPFAALLIGGAAGAQAAARDAHEAESLLPASPRRRAAASLAAAVLLLCAVAALLLATTRLCGSHLIDQLRAARPDGQFTWGTDGWDLLPRAPIAAATLLEALAASWILAYLLGHGVAGAILGLGLTAATTSGMLAGYGLDLFYASRYWHPGFSDLVLPLLALSLAAKAVAAERAAAWRERRPRLRAGGIALLAGALLAGPAAMWAGVGRTLGVLGAQMEFAESDLLASQSWQAEKLPATPRGLEAFGREAAVTTVRGGVYLAGPGGARVVVPEGAAGLTDFLFRPFEIGTVWKVLRDDDGRVWAVRERLFASELWREKPDGSAESRRLPDADHSLERVARRLVIGDWRASAQELRYADAGDFFRRGEKAAQLGSAKDLYARAAAAPDAARVACGGRCLKRGAATWRLPGRALSSAPAFPHFAGAKAAYLIPVASGAGAAAALCRADGRVETAWRLRASADGGWRTDFRALPDGTLYAYGPERTVGFVDASGHAAHFVSLARLFRDYPGEKGAWDEVLRRDADGSLRVAWAGRLFALDKSGAVLSARRLPAGARVARPLRDGFLVAASGGLYFLDWDGNARRVLKR